MTAPLSRPREITRKFQGGKARRRREAMRGYDQGPAGDLVDNAQTQVKPAPVSLSLRKRATARRATAGTTVALRLCEAAKVSTSKPVRRNFTIVRG